MKNLCSSCKASLAIQAKFRYSAMTISDITKMYHYSGKPAWVIMASKKLLFRQEK